MKHKKQPFPKKVNLFYFALAFYIAKIRYYWFVRLRSALGKEHRTHTGTKALEYSQSKFGRINLDHRIFWPMFALSSAPDLEMDSLLIIGPRFETEIFLARAIGFPKEKIAALDTYSYSPLVAIGDMHEMPFENDSFSAIICGWTISYSENPKLAASEMSRVLKPGGYVVLAVQKVPSDFDEQIDGILTGKDRVQTLKQFDHLFSGFDRVVGFEPMHNLGNSSHTLVCYRRPAE